MIGTDAQEQDNQSMSNKIHSTVKNDRDKAYKVHKNE